jgi:hypothetical protein
MSSLYPANAPGSHRLRPLSDRANCDPWVNRSRQMTLLERLLRPRTPQLPVTNVIPPTPPKPELTKVERTTAPPQSDSVPIPTSRKWFSPVSSLPSRSPDAETRTTSPLAVSQPSHVALLHPQRHPPSMTRYQNYRLLVLLSQSQSHLLYFYRVTRVRICLL